MTAFDSYQAFFDTITDADDAYMMVTPSPPDAPYEEQYVTFLYPDGASETVYRKDYETLDLEYAPSDEDKTPRQIMWEKFRDALKLNRIIFPVLLSMVALIIAGCNNSGRASTYSGSASPTPRPTLDASFYVGCNGILTGKGTCALEHERWQKMRSNLEDSPLDNLYSHTAFRVFHRECAVGAMRQRRSGDKSVSGIPYFGEHEALSFLGCIALSIEPDNAGLITTIEPDDWYNECVGSKGYGRIQGSEISRILSCTVNYIESDS